VNGGVRLRASSGSTTPGRRASTITPWRWAGPYDQSGVGSSGPWMKTTRWSCGCQVATPQQAPASSRRVPAPGRSRRRRTRSVSRQIESRRRRNERHTRSAGCPATTRLTFVRMWPCGAWVICRSLLTIIHQRISSSLPVYSFFSPRGSAVGDGSTFAGAAGAGDTSSRALPDDLLWGSGSFAGCVAGA